MPMASPSEGKPGIYIGLAAQSPPSPWRRHRRGGQDPAPATAGADGRSDCWPHPRRRPAQRPPKSRPRSLLRRGRPRKRRGRSRQRPSAAWPAGSESQPHPGEKAERPKPGERPSGGLGSRSDTPVRDEVRCQRQVTWTVASAARAARARPVELHQYQARALALRRRGWAPGHRPSTSPNDITLEQRAEQSAARGRIRPMTRARRRARAEWGNNWPAWRTRPPAPSIPSSKIVRAGRRHRAVDLLPPQVEQIIE